MLNTKEKKNPLDLQKFALNMQNDVRNRMYRTYFDLLPVVNVFVQRYATFPPMNSIRQTTGVCSFLRMGDSGGNWVQHVVSLGFGRTSLKKRSSAVDF